MTHFTTAAAIAIAITVGTGQFALAQTPANATTTGGTGGADTAQHTVHIPGTMVYFRDGVQYDVPNHLMGRHGLLINGLPPEPAEAG